MTDAYLEELPGYKDIRVRGGSVLPRRNVLSVDGAVAADDAVGAQTRLTVRMPFSVQRLLADEHPSLNSSFFLCPNTDADMYRSVNITGLAGLGAPKLGGRYRVWFVAHGNEMTVFHHHVSAISTEQISTPDGENIVVPLDGKIMLAYFNARWRVFG